MTCRLQSSPRSSHPRRRWICLLFALAAFAVASSSERQTQNDLGKLRAEVRGHPDSAEAHASLGAALSDAKEWDEAVAELRKATELAPLNTTIEYNLGLVYLQKARQNEGESAVSRKQDLQSAMRILLKLSKDAPQLPGIHMHLGWLFHELGDPVTSLQEFQAATVQEPNSAEAYNDYGTALGQQEKYEDAIAEYRKAIALDPRLVSAALNLETAAHRAGKDADQLHWAEEEVKAHVGSASGTRVAGICIGPGSAD